MPGSRQSAESAAECPIANAGGTRDIAVSGHTGASAPRVESAGGTDSSATGSRTSSELMSERGLRFARFERTTDSESGSLATKMSQPPSLNAENTTRSFSRDHEMLNTPPIRSVSCR